MSDTKFQRGDLVILRSGGPVMTVERESLWSRTSATPTSVVCAWFDGPRKMQQSFSMDSLKAAPDQS